MKEIKQLIVFAEDWGRFPSSTQHLIIGLLKREWSIIWINSVGLRKPTLHWSYFSRILDKLYQAVFSKTKKHSLSLHNKLTVINPMIVPLMGFSIIDKLNCFILNKQLSRIRKNKNFEHPIIWTTLPTAYPFMRIFDFSPLVYYCCDDYAALTDVPNPYIPIFEQRLIEKANLIIVVSDVLAQKMPAAKTYYLDQAIDLPFFMTKYVRPNDLPQGKPVAGFYGSLTHWVDINLLYQCAVQLSDWNFVLIGPKVIDIGRLLSLSNVFYLGVKPYNEIPAYSQHWDVGLIPFIKNQLVNACNPLKIKEYLATGKPVVSVDIPALNIYKDCIHLAKDDEEFIAAIQLSRSDNNQEKRASCVINQGWDDRAVVLEDKLLNL